MCLVKMPRTKAQDAERKRIAYKNNDAFREKHKEAMRMKYHENKARMSALRSFGLTSIYDAQQVNAVHGISLTSSPERA